jgi:hypothetical protein
MVRGGESPSLGFWGLSRLASTVREADIKAHEQMAPGGTGLHTIAEPLALVGLSDEKSLATQLAVYDALYEYLRRRGE